jgi:hypothetical protein
MAGGIDEELSAAGFPDAVEVGRGGGGVVFRCRQKSLGRSVAVKVLGSDLDEDDRERFLREGYAMGVLSGHPNIANILQVGMTESNRPFIVMPYHSKGSLAQRVRQEGPIPWAEVLRIGAVLYKATLQDPAERYATAEEFGRALQSVQRSTGLTEDAMALASES